MAVLSYQPEKQFEDLARLLDCPVQVLKGALEEIEVQLKGLYEVPPKSSVYAEPEDATDLIIAEFERRRRLLKTAIAVKEGQKRPTEPEGIPRRFPAPDDLKWEEVSIVFTSNDTIRVSARGVSRTFHFAEIGFKDERTADRPDSLWGLLKEGFARHGGEISWTDPVDPKTRTNLKACVKVLRKRLRRFVGIEDDPFYPYRRFDSYRTKFTLRDETPTDE